MRSQEQAFKERRSWIAQWHIARYSPSMTLLRQRSRLRSVAHDCVAKVSSANPLRETTIEDTLPDDGERFLTSYRGIIRYEHLHRYALCCALVKGRDVLDVACGEGYGSALLAQDAKNVVGVDISAAAVAHASAKYQAHNLRYRVGDATALPMEAACVDVVVSFETIEHISEHEKMLQEIRRVLRPGGTLIISSPDKATYTEIPHHHNPFHVRELYTAEFEALLRKSFRNVALFGQRVCAGSLITRLNGTEAEAPLLTAYRGGIEAVRLGVPRNRAIYVIAVCSDASPNVGQVQSLYVDNDNDLFEDLQAEINTAAQMLRRSAARARLVAERAGPEVAGYAIAEGAKGCVDAVEDDASGMRVRGSIVINRRATLSIEGWALLDGRPPDRAVVAIDGSPCSSAMPVQRDDLVPLFGEGAAAGGYRGLLWLDEPAGKHVIEVLAVDEAGRRVASVGSVGAYLVEPHRLQQSPFLFIDSANVGGLDVEPDTVVDEVELVHLRGWGFDHESNEALSAAAMLVSDGRIIPCEYGFVRPDVAVALGCPSEVGAETVISATTLGPGLHEIRLLGVTSSGVCAVSENAIRLRIPRSRSMALHEYSPAEELS